MNKLLSLKSRLFKFSIRSTMLLTALVAIQTVYVINCGSATYWWFTHRQDPKINSLQRVDLKDSQTNEPFSVVQVGNLQLELPTVLAENWSVITFGTGRRLRLGSKGRFVDFSIGPYQLQRNVFKQIPIAKEELSIPEIYKSVYAHSTNKFSLLMTSRELAQHEAILGARNFFCDPNFTEYYFLEKTDIRSCSAFSSLNETFYTFEIYWEHVNATDGGFIYISDGRASRDAWVNRTLKSLRYQYMNDTPGFTANAEDSEIDKQISVSPLAD